jgi:6-methylsalicylate decarboxylase
MIDKDVNMRERAIEGGAQAAPARVDVHQHIWSEQLVTALEAREELPFVRREHGLAVLHLAGERPCVLDMLGESPAARAALVERDGIDRALICLSSPLGIESLPREQAEPLLDAYHDGALALGPRFGVWGAVALDRPQAGDVDRALARGCVGISLPACALAGADALARSSSLLRRLEDAGAPLLVHPGPAPAHARAFSNPYPLEQPSLAEPLWWPALTRYVAEMQAAWLTFVSAGRSEHPRLRVIFTMLAGLAPLQSERLASRGGPASLRPDPLLFYESSSYGADSARRLAEVVGAPQLLYGSDRPVVDPHEHTAPHELDWDALADATRRALDRRPAARELRRSEPAAATRRRRAGALLR